MPRASFFRLQFSLRALLVLMALVGAGIVVFRWPWTVTVDGKTSRTVSQFHRGWNGKAVKHGLEMEHGTEHGRYNYERQFYDGQLLNERCFVGVVPFLERNFRDGKEHGLWWAEFEGCRLEGQHYQGLRHGKWKDIRPDEVRYDEYQHGKRHGRTEWCTPAGRVLQSTEYEHGRLVKWNDRELNVELRSWVEGNVSDEEQRKIILMPITDPADGRGEYSYFGVEVYSVGRSDFAADEPPKRYLTVQRHGSHRPKRSALREIEMGRPGVCLGAALLEDALEHSQTFAYRFHTLHIVPISAESLDWEDRTGVNRIRFEPDSLAAKAWLERESANPFSFVRPDERLRKMFEPVSRTGIVIDTTAIEDPVEPDQPDQPGIMLGGGSLPGPHVELPRRDLLGIHLDREGCYCDQVGNTLVIKRHE